MDEDLKASGYSKLVEEAIEEELRPIEEESEGSDGELKKLECYLDNISQHFHT